MVELLPAGDNTRGFSWRRYFFVGMTVVRGVRGMRRSTVRRTFRARARLHAGHPFDGASDTTKEAAEVGKINERQQQAGNPENVHVGKESNQSQDGDDFELYFLPFMGDLLGQRMQAKIQDAETKDADAKSHSHNDHENVGIARRRDEHRKMVSRDGINLFSHDMPHKGQGISRPDPVTPKPV